ncbi:MAG: site-specific DNA-methyltransferase [Alphaproteobacteria bacterium]|nr:site-specific DNA-methyltransferase [Alphaproteobacteria bacterium]
MAKKKTTGKKIESLTHDESKMTNIPTAEFEEMVREDEAKPVRVESPRKNNPDETPEIYARDPELDPQLVWRGKDEEDKAPLGVDAVPVYIQEHIKPRAIIEDIRRRSQKRRIEGGEEVADLFDDWANELDPESRIEFYQHDKRWTNRMILGDSLQVMTSLVKKENLKGQVQCIYFDPPYGIKFSSNWQPSTRASKTSNAKSGESRESEVVRAFRDTWSKGVNSYLSYTRDRLLVARELLTESGSIFLQIGEENLHLLRVLMDEVFGAENFVHQIYFATTGGFPTKSLTRFGDYIVWYAKDEKSAKRKKLYLEKSGWGDEKSSYQRIESDFVRRNLTAHEKRAASPPPGKILRYGDLCGQGESKEPTPLQFRGKVWNPAKNSHWKANYPAGMNRLIKADRIEELRNSLGYVRYFDDYSARSLTNVWGDTSKGYASAADKLYVVETAALVVQRCILMTTDPGDLVLDPTCGSGTTATVAEQWGRRWITIDTSRVSLALARARLMGCRFEHYVLADSERGQKMEGEITGRSAVQGKPGNSLKFGFVYERLPHVTLGSISNNAEIDTIWGRWQETLEPLRAKLNEATGQKYEEWEIPREADESWTAQAGQTHRDWWNARLKRQEEIDASIARNAETEYLYDRPYAQKDVVRVTGPFTVESLSPHRIIPTDTDDEALLAHLEERALAEGKPAPERESRRLRPRSVENGETRFHEVVFENLKAAGVQNTKKGERLEFVSLEPWLDSQHIQFEGRYEENGREKKAAVCVGPEYGTVTRSLMVQAAREASDHFDLLVILGFAFEAHADEAIIHLGRMPVLRARMNNDLHMADRLKAGKSGNLFVVFGEPDIELRELAGDMLEVEIKGVDIFDPTTGEVKASGPGDIACWFIDTDYNEEAFFVRHAYFSGGGPDPYKRLKTTLKAEINQEAWETLYSTVSRPFPKPDSGRIAVKAINHFGDEVLKVFNLK